MPQSRYLFAISCFQMDLLKEAEAALCNANEPGAEVRDLHMQMKLLVPTYFTINSLCQSKLMFFIISQEFYCVWLGLMDAVIC